VTAAPRPRVVLVDGIPMSALVARADSPRAVLVAVHGGGTTSAYFDCPGHPELSLLRAAAARGVTAIALDRPGYGASSVYAGEFADTERRTAVALAAVEKILGGTPAAVALIGHSAGCELALRLATAMTDVVGVEVAGTGRQYTRAAAELLAEATMTRRPPGLRHLLWEPSALYPREVLTGGLSTPGCAYEAEATTHWGPRDFPAVAGRLTVPVQYSVADHERVWDVGSDELAAIAAQFGASPHVAINEMADSGHNLSVGYSAAEYHRRVLDFVDECLARTREHSTSREEAS
jgi:pimeloyl-ACP methyl ester carboxylesterase